MFIYLLIYLFMNVFYLFSMLLEIANSMKPYPFVSTHVPVY